ncbi:4-alpha-glucanotransferase [[Clostridium] fimetarium]|uniref:4-alpha-glucanotransferase n=1 Tax=[Clostridium] fimetarium TaxID=99656 RepID=A0A1I0R7P9_9FIRM|nr:4-alpha-glucanotransferase [[Clostridium] fimetarium]SEW36739.1 starch phosphorylase/4-alpha-glucanotransferase [[Clostridium] fimetarium]
MGNQTKCQKFNRSAGILMAISSISSPYGIGTFGKAAYEFIDFVKNADHKYWQVLPLGPTGYGDSPYQTCSIYAGNPYYIDLDILVEEGLLTKSYVLSFDWGDDILENQSYVDYEKIFLSRFLVLATAFENFKSRQMENGCKEYDDFVALNNDWLEDYSLYMACKAYFGYSDWNKWDDEVKYREPAALLKYKAMLAKEIEFWEFCQFEFFKQWNKLKNYANEKGIEIIGDIPIYTALDSADVWVNTEIFQLDEKLEPTMVAGVPPDAFTSLGQKWGNPIYDWDAMEKDNFVWWKKRMEKSAQLYDVIRIDHFIGIVKYYTIPAQCPDARIGEYKIGPGKKLTDVINSAIKDKKIIAENLGVAIPEVEELLKENDYTVMEVLEFAFDGNSDNPHIPYNYEKNSVVYGGTHDNETLQGFFNERNDQELEYAYDYLGTRDKNLIVDHVFRAAYGSVANVVIFQVQDVLKLDNSARMNFPSTLGDNWKWRLRSEQLNETHSNYLKHLARIFGRK